jgi:aspartokinase/homoserine dehydrogenase 1
MKVLKFGGTSVGNADRIREVVACVQASPDCVAVVVSAMTGVTDALLEMALSAARGDVSYKGELEALEQRHLDAAEELFPPTNRESTLDWVSATVSELDQAMQSIFVLRECSPKTSDYILSFGERLSAYLVSKVLSSDATFVDAREIIVTDANFGNASADLEVSGELIRKTIGVGKPLAVVTGFIGATSDGRTTTLGRGGSDLTASILGAAIGASEIEIWTDVDGIMTADPRVVPTAFSIDHLSYEEAMELSHFGAKILYPPTIQPALIENIPIRIRNTFNPGFEGSVIDQNAKSQRLVTGISSIPKVALLRVQGLGLQGITGTSKRVFAALANQNINVMLITQASSEHTICFSVLPDVAEKARTAIDKEFEHEIKHQLVEPVVVEKELSVVSVVGEQMRHMSGLSGRLFSALGANGVNVVAIAQGSSELNISVVISRADRTKALNAVHDAFFLSDQRTAHLFIAGDGLIGKTLTRQISEGKDSLGDRYKLKLQVNGLTNTRFMAFDDKGLVVEKAEQARGSQPAGREHFIQTIVDLNLPHSVFVDCTASDEVPTYYPKLLDSNISIVTPNKRALTGRLKAYQELKTVEHRRGVQFHYETCVGAGLPIIGTLNDLVKSGDEIYSVEAVLSGTLSYIFNSYVKGRSFAETVREAQHLGLTEPDPRDDLSGRDVGRKLLILAREIGCMLEPEDVLVEDLVPSACASAVTVAEFYELLEAQEEIFAEKLNSAMASGGRLCYVGRVSDGKAEAKLTMVLPDHPFYGLSGSDNIISFVTKRYSVRPLVVKGPGAGPEVTAAGVLADIIRVVG